MDTPRPYKRILLFGVGLLVVFGAAAAVGSLVEPAETEGGTEGKMAAHADEGTHHGTSHEPAGLGVSADGYTLRLRQTQMERGRARELQFAIEDGSGDPVTEFDELHERRLHLIVVRRDGTGFRHLHPEMDVTGTWTTPIEFAEPGVYRAFADFSVDGGQQTLAADLFVSGGEFEARPFPAPRTVDQTDGYEVRLKADEATAGEAAALSFTVARNGSQVEGLAPYLGARGHLVALREGDLAFLHVHPQEGPGVAPEEIAFEATFPTAGRYRLYLQFKHGGAVHTAEFTLVVPR
jgi:hypothetical protein